METRIAVIGIILDNTDSVDQLNHLLSENSQYIVGRMGIPYREKDISLISIFIDAPNDIISALSGKLGMLPGVNAKTLYAKTNQSIEHRTNGKSECDSLPLCHAPEEVNL